MLAAAVVLLGSVAAAVVAVVAVLREPAVPARRVLVPVPREAELPLLPQLPQGPEVLVVARVPLRLLLLPLLSPQAVVESEVTLRLKGRQSCSAAMARSSLRTVQPTYERAPSTRSPRKGRTCPSACLNSMPVRG